MRRVTVALVAVALAIAVFLLWPRSNGEEPPSAEAISASTTTSSTPVSTTLGRVATTEPAPTSTTDDSHVVASVEEAETILRDLWFGWFEGIYNEDEERIREVVILEETVETAKASFGQMEFSERPSAEGVAIGSGEILRADSNCLVLFSTLDVSAFRPNATGSEGAYVLRWTGDRWGILSVWTNAGDRWQADCESQLP